MMTKKQQQAVKSDPSSQPKPGSQASTHVNPGCCSTATATLEKPSKFHHDSKLTKIIVNYDVGFNNALYIRGQGANLSWEKGVLMKNVRADEWIWETECPFTNAEFKILVNDKAYEIGQNHTLHCGATIRFSPKF